MAGRRAPKMTTFSFHATRVKADADEETATLAFEVEGDGDPSVFFTLCPDPDGEAAVRLWWADGKDARDEVSISLASVELLAEKFVAAFQDPSAEVAGRYSGVSITFEALEEADAREALEALALIAPTLVKLPEKKPVPSRATVLSEGPRRRGAPMLGVASRSSWQVKVKKSLDIELLVSNRGGPLQGGVVVEVAAAALEEGLIEARAVAGSGPAAAFDRKGRIAAAVIPDLAIPADLDIDRRSHKDAAPPPVAVLTLTLQALRVGSSLLTVRVIPARNPDRSGGAMCGRSFVVET